MVSSFKKSLDYLKKSKEFKDWEKDSKKSYLADGFVMFDGNHNLKEIDWQIDFYSPQEDEMTSFIVSGKSISLKEEQKLVKGKEEYVNELKLEGIKISLKEAIDKVKEKYPQEIPDKIIIILQNIEVPLWNITFLTSSFHILNVKINAESGDILEESLKPVFEIQKK